MHTSVLCNLGLDEKVSIPSALWIGAYLYKKKDEEKHSGYENLFALHFTFFWHDVLFSSSPSSQLIQGGVFGSPFPFDPYDKWTDGSLFLMLTWGGVVWLRY